MRWDDGMFRELLVEQRWNEQGLTGNKGQSAKLAVSDQESNCFTQLLLT